MLDRAKLSRDYAFPLDALAHRFIAFALFLKSTPMLRFTKPCIAFSPRTSHCGALACLLASFQYLSLANPGLSLLFNSAACLFLSMPFARYFWSLPKPTQSGASLCLYYALQGCAVPMHFSSLLIPRFTGHCCALRFPCFPKLRSSVAWPDLASAVLFSSVPGRISSLPAHGNSVLIHSLSQHCYASPFKSFPRRHCSVLILCLSVLNWASPLLFKSCRRISFALQCWAGHGHAIPFQFLAIPLLGYASPMLASA